MYIYIYIYCHNRVLSNGPGDWGSIPNRVISKLVFDTFLNTQHYKVRIKGKWSNRGKGVAHSPSL